MIGIAANPSDRAVIREFFELFKTPWEFYELGRNYDALLCVGNQEYNSRDAKIVLLYSSGDLLSDTDNQIEIAGRYEGRLLSFQKTKLPIYGQCLVFANEQSTSCLLDHATGKAAFCSYTSQNGAVLRIGYDLCAEIRSLLNEGQPVEYAEIPTLEVHIALLRGLIVSRGVTLVEIPPVPDGFRFIVCLTHDVDHASIRKHICDRTMMGFLYRAILGSLISFLRGSIPPWDLWKNWATVLRLPLVYLGLAKDFWQDFVARYHSLEQGLPSTYFVIPFANRPGRDAHGSAPAYRAARYGAEDIAGLIADAMANGCEVGLHGIDAWADCARGREELEKIRQISGCAEIGSRMHWLYFDESAPLTLERAGIDYDSTIGYREAVGFRAGITQAYKPLQAKRLLELPLHAMDTALFYPAYLGLTSDNATKVLNRLTDQVERFGGCLVINWHDRSLAPERLWYACYGRLLNELKARGAWFATAGQAIAWFRQRRSAVFEPKCTVQELSLTQRIGGGDGNRLPGLCLRTHERQIQPDLSSTMSFVDAPLSPASGLQMSHASGE
ncbi:MAG: hypothetical protein WAL45_18465 [Terracidiphilus sp.]